MEDRALSCFEEIRKLEEQIKALDQEHFEDAATIRRFYNNPVTRGNAYGVQDRDEHDRLVSRVPRLELKLDRLKEELEAALEELKEAVCKRQSECFTKAQNSDESLLWNRGKLVLIGQAAAGKTALVRAIMGLDFKEDLEATAGAEFTEAKAVSGRPWIEAEKQSFELELLLRIVPKYKPRRSLRRAIKFSGIIASQGYDLAHNYQEMEELKGDLNGISVSIWDFGGHKYFHSLQHLLLTGLGVYLVVFDISQIVSGDTRDTLDQIEFWLKSLKFHAPCAPFLLVGTRLGGITADNRHWATVDTLQEQVLGLDASLKAGLVTNDTSPLFLVDNELGNGVEHLRLAIMDTTRKQDFFTQTVSCKWMKCLDFILENGPHLEVERLQRYMRENQIEAEAEELANMLNIFHSYGLILYYSSNCVLSELIVSNPEWIVESVKKAIIYPQAYVGYRAKLKASLLGSDLTTLRKSGFASRALLESLWNNEKTEYFCCSSCTSFCF